MKRVQDNTIVFPHTFMTFPECIIGFYGENCNKTCTHCNSSAPSCDRHYGHCLFGCEDGRNSTNCGDSFFLFFFCVFIVCFKCLLFL